MRHFTIPAVIGLLVVGATVAVMAFGFSRGALGGAPYPIQRQNAGFVFVDQGAYVETCDHIQFVYGPQVLMRCVTSRRPAFPEHLP